MYACRQCWYACAGAPPPPPDRAAAPQVRDVALTVDFRMRFIHARPSEEIVRVLLYYGYPPCVLLVTVVFVWPFLANGSAGYANSLWNYGDADSCGGRQWEDDRGAPRAARDRDLKLLNKMRPFVILGFCWSLFSVLSIYSETEKDTDLASSAIPDTIEEDTRDGRMALPELAYE
ncbi:hypothetical protein JL722_12810 [Aureococcus anophagefferens]|nr:hypothetical protein JL722_12810 [Aureococcus anophagefferens]